MMQFNDPDPAWDYCEIWQNLEKIREEYEVLVAHLSRVENASLESDRAIRDRLERIRVLAELSLLMLRTASK